MSKERYEELRRLTHKQIVSYLKEAAEGDELLLKEVFEECDNPDEIKVVMDETKRLCRVVQVWGPALADQIKSLVG